MLSQDSTVLNSNINDRLLDNVQNGSYEGVVACLMAGAKAASVLSNCGRTAVGTAAILGNGEILELLIKSCEEPELDIFSKNAVNSEIEINITPDGMDCLEWEDEFSVFNDDLKISDDSLEEHTLLYRYYAKTFEKTGSLISYMEQYSNERNQLIKQDPHIYDAFCMTPLHYSAACGTKLCAKILLRHGAKVNALNSDGVSPLHVGIEFYDIINLLLKNGANVNLKTFNTGETALHLSIRSHCFATANILLNSPIININETDNIDQTPLIAAVACSFNDVALTLIRNCARINLQDKEGYTALYYAVISNNILIAESLLNYGARRVTSHYLIHYCVTNNMVQMAKLLISNGECLNIRNNDGMTPIMLAIASQNLEILDFLLEQAIEQEKQGISFMDRIENNLIVAVQYINNLEQFLPIARLLFFYGDFSWMNPLPLISHCNIPYCQTPIARAIMLKKFDIAKFLLKEGADISQVCQEHVNNLRFLNTADSAKFSKFLVCHGFKFPFNIFTRNINVKSEHETFEKEMRYLHEKPLSLQYQTRIVIRRQLSYILRTSKYYHKSYKTKSESVIARMIRELEIPKTLQTFLVDFDEKSFLMSKTTF